MFNNCSLTRHSRHSCAEYIHRIHTLSSQIFDFDWNPNSSSRCKLLLEVGNELRGGYLSLKRAACLSFVQSGLSGQQLATSLAVYCALCLLFNGASWSYARGICASVNLCQVKWCQCELVRGLANPACLWISQFLSYEIELVLRAVYMGAPEDIIHHFT